MPQELVQDLCKFQRSDAGENSRLEDSPFISETWMTTLFSRANQLPGIAFPVFAKQASSLFEDLCRKGLVLVCLLAVLYAAQWVFVIPLPYMWRGRLLRAQHVQKYLCRGAVPLIFWKMMNQRC